MEERSHLRTICLLGMLLCFNKATPVASSSAMPKKSSTVNPTNAVSPQASINNTLPPQDTFVSTNGSRTDAAQSTQAPSAIVPQEPRTNVPDSTKASKGAAELTQGPTHTAASGTGAVSTDILAVAVTSTKLDSSTDAAASTEDPDLVLTTDADTSVSTNGSTDAAQPTQAPTDDVQSTKAPAQTQAPSNTVPQKPRTKVHDSTKASKDLKNACKYEKVYVTCIIALGILLAIVLLIVACLVCRTLKTKHKTKTSRIEKHELLTDSIANEDEEKNGKEDDPENSVTIQVSEVRSTFATVPPESQTDAATTESPTDATGSTQDQTDTVISIEVLTDVAVSEAQGPLDAAGSSQGTNNAAESDVLAQAPLSAAVSTMCPTDTAVSPQAPTDAAESTPSPTDLLSEVLTNVDVPNQSPADSAMSSPALVNAAVSSQVSTDAQDPTNAASEEMPNNDVKKSTNQEEGIVETAI